MKMKFILPTLCFCVGLAHGFIQLQPQPVPVIQARQPGPPLPPLPPPGVAPNVPLQAPGQLVPGPGSMPTIFNATMVNQTHPNDPVTGRSLFSSFSFFGGEEKGGGKYKEDKKDHLKDLKQHFEDKKMKLKGKGGKGKDDEYDDDYDKKGKGGYDDDYEKKGKDKYDDDYGKDYGKEKSMGYGKDKDNYDDEYAKKPAAKGYDAKPKYEAKGYDDDDDYRKAKPKPKGHDKEYDDDYKEEPKGYKKEKGKAYDDDDGDYRKAKPKGKGQDKEYDDDYKEESKGYKKEKGKAYEDDDDYRKAKPKPKGHDKEYDDYKEEPKGYKEKGKAYDDDYGEKKAKGKGKADKYDDDDYRKTKEGKKPNYPDQMYSGYYKVDPNPNGKYIPQYRMSPGNAQTMKIVPGTLVRGVPQMMGPPMMGMMRNHTGSTTGHRMFPAHLRSLQMNFTNPRYRAAAGAYGSPAPAAPAYNGPAASTPAYQAPPKAYGSPAPAPAPYAAASQPAPAQYKAAAPPAAYGKAPASGYDASLQSSANYGDLSLDEYNRAKLKLYPVNMYPAAPPIEIITNEGGYDGPSNYNYTKPATDGGYGAPAAGPYAGPAPAADYVAPGGYGAPAAPLPSKAPGYGAPADLYEPSEPYSAPYGGAGAYGAPAAYGGGGGYGDYRMPVAVANLYCSRGKKCSCTLYMTEINANNMLISGVCSGLAKNKYFSLHIFEHGDITHGCDSLGGHYNPRNSTHGGTNGPSNHAGDLGNLKSDDNGVAFVNKLKRDTLSVMCPRYGQSFSILGRSLGLSDSKDDYGLGANYGSLNNGNSGKVIACGVIGLANKDNSYETRELKLAMAQAAANEQQQQQSSKAKKDENSKDENAEDSETNKEDGKNEE